MGARYGRWTAPCASGGRSRFAASVDDSTADAGPARHHFNPGLGTDLQRYACVTADYDALLLDFFGTLVDYSPSRTEQGYDSSFGLLRSLGCGLDYDGFLTAWSAMSERFDDEAEAHGGEFSMDEIVEAFLTEVVGGATPEQVSQFRDCYNGEWSSAIRPIAGVADMLEDLAGDLTIAVVTNTHDLTLVPGLLTTHGLAPSLTTTVMSVNVRCRKPYPGIFAATVDDIGVDPSRCLFVGDSYVPDYLGPTRFGMHALLIDPLGASAAPVDHRIASILEVAERLA